MIYSTHRSAANSEHKYQRTTLSDTKPRTLNPATISQFTTYFYCMKKQITTYETFVCAHIYCLLTLKRMLLRRDDVNHKHLSK